MAILTIHALQCPTTIGVYDWEQSRLQMVLVTFSVSINTRVQDLDPKQDYAALCEALQAYMRAKKTLLLETLTEDIALFIRNFTQTKSIELTVNKLHAIPDSAGVCITLQRNYE